METLFDNLERKFKSWRGKTLSLGGGITLLNVVLSASLLYCMSYFIMLKWVKLRIDWSRNRFL